MTIQERVAVAYNGLLHQPTESPLTCPACKKIARVVCVEVAAWLRAEKRGRFVSDAACAATADELDPPAAKEKEVDK